RGRGDPGHLTPGADPDRQLDAALRIGVLLKPALVAVAEAGAHAGHDPAGVAHRAAAHCGATDRRISLGSFDLLNGARRPGAGATARLTDARQPTAGLPRTDRATGAAELQVSGAAS